MLIDSGASSSTVPLDVKFCEFLSGYQKYAVDDAHRFICANGGIMTSDCVQDISVALADGI